MLRTYERILELTNYKLFVSLYKENIVQVMDVLESFGPKADFVFLNNLRNLKMKKITDKEIKKYGSDVGAFYDRVNNEIYLPEDAEDVSQTINHELFHVASSKGGRLTGIESEKDLGVKYLNLNEGITEYLNLKSMNKKQTTSAYELDLFVVQFLVFIYGEGILRPYFENNGEKFFVQFDGDQKTINKLLWLEFYLKENFDNAVFHKDRLRYLALVDDKVDKIPHEFKYFALNKEANKLIKEVLKQEAIELNEFVKYDTNYEYKSQVRKTFHNDLISKYKFAQQDNFRKIFDVMIDIAQSQSKSIDEISDFIYDNLFYRDDDFKELYIDIIAEGFGNTVKKR